MTDLKFSILEFIYNSPYHECGEVALFNQKFGPHLDVEEALKDLTQSVHDYTTNRDHPPMIVRNPIGTGTLKLTSSGNTTYETAKEEREDKAKQKRQQGFNNKISIASVLIPLVTFVLGIVVEACTNTSSWIASLLG